MATFRFLNFSRAYVSPGNPSSGTGSLRTLSSSGFCPVRAINSRAARYLAGTAAMLARYRAALEFIARTGQNPELDKVLNDPVPELGLPGDTYARLKFKNLNVAMATQFGARQILLKTFSGPHQPALE